MNINQVRTLANINARASKITADYRLIWNRRERCFMVAHKTDRARRYKVTADSCTCPSAANYGECKHHLGLPALLEVEIKRYTLLGFADDRERMEAFLEDIEQSAQWKDVEHVERMAERYAAA